MSEKPIDEFENEVSTERKRTVRFIWCGSDMPAEVNLTPPEEGEEDE